MKDRRGFLKLLGIGAGAAAAGVLAIVAGTPAPAPRTIQDIEKIKPYIGPNGVPEGDYIKERPKVVPNITSKIPEITHDQYQWIVDGHKILTTVEWNTIVEPGSLIPTVDLGIVLTTDRTYTTSGTYNHNLGGYLTTCDIKS